MEQRQVCSCGKVREQEGSFIGVNGVGKVIKSCTEIKRVTFAIFVRGVGFENRLEVL